MLPTKAAADENRQTTTATAARSVNLGMLVKDLRAQAERVQTVLDA